MSCDQPFLRPGIRQRPEYRGIQIKLQPHASTPRGAANSIASNIRLSSHFFGSWTCPHSLSATNPRSSFRRSSSRSIHSPLPAVMALDAVPWLHDSALFLNYFPGEQLSDRPAYTPCECYRPSCLGQSYRLIVSGVTCYGRIIGQPFLLFGCQFGANRGGSSATNSAIL